MDSYVSEFYQMFIEELITNLLSLFQKVEEGHFPMDSKRSIYNLYQSQKKKNHQNYSQYVLDIKILNTILAN